MPRWPDEHRRRRRLPWPLRLAIILFVCALFLPSVVGWTRGAVQCRIFGGEAGAREGTLPAGSEIRPEEQTYLTLPEWYIVYSADEYAAYLANNRPSGFPYFQAVGQFWQAYYDVCTVTRDRYPFNSDTQLMLAVIGVSFTAENVFKGIYENTIGRLSEWSASGQPTPEELYGRQVAAEYGTFLHTVPWYEFPFWAKIGPLWSSTPAEPDVVRKVERRLALTLEYGVKAGYGWAIKQAAGSVYDAEKPEIMALAEGVTPELDEREPELRIVDVPEGQPARVALPRYEAFTKLVPRLVEQDVRFAEIAGNDEIMITVLAPREWRWSPSTGTQLFTMPILTQPDRARVAVQVPVNALHTVILDLARLSTSNAVTLEHIYDY